MASSSLDGFFGKGSVMARPRPSWLLRDVFSGITEMLTLNGTFGGYVGDYPTTGRSAAISYSITGGTALTCSHVSISVADFTA